MLLLGARLQAQSAATVPASSGVYDKVESVSAFFPARGVFLGERPLSRRDVFRVIALLLRAIDSAPPETSAQRRDWARRELAATAAVMNRERGVYRSPSTMAAFSWSQGLTGTDAQSERITSNGLGVIDAVTHPFAPGRQGRSITRGATSNTSLTGLLGLREHWAFVVEPLLTMTSQHGDSTRSQVMLARAYGRVVFRNVALRLGADELRWGQSPQGSLFISGNASPLPALSVGTDTPVTLPWLFRLAGPVRVTALLADLGRSQDPPHAKLAGWQVSIEPWARFELGVAVLAQSGGDGGPPATFLQRVVDLFPVIDAIAPQHADLQISNKLAGGNLRLRLPELSGLDVCYELQIDDFDARRLRSSFVDDAGHLLGMRLPLLIGNGQLTWRAEWHRTSLRLYEHAQFRSGVTYREHIIGNPLGPNAKAAYLSGAWRRSPDREIEVTLGDESRDPSVYMTTSNNPRDEGFRFVRVSDDPRYRRRRVFASLEEPLRLGALQLGIGYNRAWRRGAASRDEWLGQLTLRSHRLPTF